MHDKIFKPDSALGAVSKNMEESQTMTIQLPKEDKRTGKTVNLKDEAMLWIIENLDNLKTLVKQADGTVKPDTPPIPDETTERDEMLRIFCHEYELPPCTIAYMVLRNLNDDCIIVTLNDEQLNILLNYIMPIHRRFYKSLEYKEGSSVSTKIRAARRIVNVAKIKYIYPSGISMMGDTTKHGPIVTKNTDPLYEYCIFEEYGVIEKGETVRQLYTLINEKSYRVMPYSRYVEGIFNSCSELEVLKDMMTTWDKFANYGPYRELNYFIRTISNAVKPDDSNSSGTRYC